MAAHRVDPAQHAIIAELLAQDADLRAMAHKMLSNGLRDLINLQERGDPAVRAQLAKLLAGPIVSAITEPVEEDQFGSLRAEMLEMMGEWREQMTPEREVDQYSASKGPTPSPVPDPGG